MLETKKLMAQQTLMNRVTVMIPRKETILSAAVFIRTFVFIKVFVLSCASSNPSNELPPGYSSMMQADGNTWIVKYGSATPWQGCNYDIESHQICANLALAEISKIGKNTCGLEPSSIHSCERLAPGTFVSCKIQCKESPNADTERNKPNDEIMDKAFPKSQPTGSEAGIFQRAKRCAEKGGVWINNACQIEIDN